MTTENPYQAPEEETTTAPPHPDDPELKRIVRNIRAICILYIVFGSLLVVVGATVILSIPFTNKGEFERDILPLLPVALIGLPLGIVGVASALGVLRRRSWGIPLCRVASVAYLLSFPIGTILGGYFLLNIRKVERVFT